MKNILLVLSVFLMLSFVGCNYTRSSDEKERDAQENILNQANNKLGMPAITSFRETAMLKLILELRDDPKYITYSYLYSPMTGKYTFIAKTIGYPIPYSTQYTNPQKFDQALLNSSLGQSRETGILAQADPNGLFSPAASDATWMMSADKDGNPVVLYEEQRVTCRPYKLPKNELNFIPEGY